MPFRHSSAEQPEVEAQAKKQDPPAEKDPKADKATTFEDAEVEGQGRHIRIGPAEQPEVEAHRIKFH
jgi:hypothetical protein